MLTTSRRHFLASSSAAGLAAASAAASPAAMKKAQNERPGSFLLVHGGFHGGWCYARVADILRSRGHRVFTPTLTGLGERSNLSNIGVNCSMHVQDIVNVIRWERLHQVTLCGHSYAGMVIGAVADRMHERIASLVYLDAVVPENGKSLLDLLDPAFQSTMMSAAAASGGLMLPPSPAAALNVNAADQAMVDELCTPQPFASLCERLELTGAYKKIPRKMFIRATAPAGPMPAAMFARVADEISKDPSWSVEEVACGHDIMLDAPDRLAELLLRAT